MRKIRKLYYFDKKNTEEMISFLNNNANDNYVNNIMSTCERVATVIPRLQLSRPLVLQDFVRSNALCYHILYFRLSALFPDYVNAFFSSHDVFRSPFSAAVQRRSEAAGILRR